MYDHEVRELRFRLKQAHATMGRQGNTIHSLRAELALVRRKHTKIERDQLQNLENSVEMLRHNAEHDHRRLEAQRDTILELRQKLAAATQVNDYRQ